MCCDVRQAHKTTVQATSNRQIIASLLFDFDIATLQVTEILRLRFVAFVLRTRLSEPDTAKFHLERVTGILRLRFVAFVLRTRLSGPVTAQFDFGVGNGNTALALRGVRATHSAERTRYRTISIWSG